MKNWLFKHKGTGGMADHGTDIYRCGLLFGDLMDMDFFWNLMVVSFHKWERSSLT